MTTDNRRKQFNRDMLELFSQRHGVILSWLKQHECSQELPFYSSVDVRDAGFKIAVVDTNIFPAGFNNLCPHGLDDAALLFRLAIRRRVPGAKRLLLIAEEHTRNTWYLENVRILQDIIQRAGFEATVATFLRVQPEFCERTNFVEVATAADKPLRVYCLKNLLEEYRAGKREFDLVILNNDLIEGIPDILKQSPVPVYPSLQAGWHSRLKSLHFNHMNDLLKDFSSLLDIDPWIFSTAFRAVEDIDVGNEDHRVRLQDTASELLQEIRGQYRRHDIEEQPYLVVKADAGTYGMGVLAIEDPSELTALNRKGRNKLSSGKGSVPITRYLLQEGVPTIHEVDEKVSEVCMYQVENHLIGGFFRSHSTKGSRDNLNARGMLFKKICPHREEFKEMEAHNGTHEPEMFDVYRILARVAAIAAHREIRQLEEAL
ncbi:MAG: glutamate--cysteine ligase [Candidatus Omnitrophota bacterium]